MFKKPDLAPSTSRESAALRELHKTLGVATESQRISHVAEPVRRDLSGLSSRLRQTAVVERPIVLPEDEEEIEPVVRSSGRWILPLAAAGAFAMSMCCCGSVGGLFIVGNGVLSSGEAIPHSTVPYKPRQSSHTSAPTTVSTAAPSVASGKSLDSATDSNFKQAIEQGEKAVVVDFYTTWCGYCKVEEPLLAQVAAEFAGKVVVLRVDAEASPNTAAKYKINAYPTLVEFKNGKEIGRVVGTSTLPELQAEFAALVKK